MSSWLQTTNFIKTALKEAQKTIDKALDISNDSSQSSNNSESPKEVENIVIFEDDDQMTKSNMTIESSIVCQEEECDHGGFDDDGGSMMSSIQEMSSSQYDDGKENNIEPDQIVSLTESKWSTIEVETIETSHSRNSSITTIPESNSSPERDVGRHGHNYVSSGQHVLQDSNSSTRNTNTTSSTKIVNDDGDQNRHDEREDFVECSLESKPNNSNNGDMIEIERERVVQETIIDSCNSSSSFEHVSASRLDTIENSIGGVKESEPDHRDMSSPSPLSNQDGGDNKLITKVKTNASSASSSDIEVIPLDPEDQTIAKILQEAETQTDESLFRRTGTHSGTKRAEVAVQVQIVKPEEVHPAMNNKVVAQMEAKLSEKDNEIEQLMEEGKKLSKKQFELSNIVKKLRAKEKETDNKMTSIKNELTEKCVEVERLIKSFVLKETVEQSQNETITKLNAEKRSLESQIDRLTSELEDAQENCSSMKVSLENTSLEILETKNIILATQREAAEVDRLTKEKSELLNRSETLQKQVDHLRTVVHETQRQSSERERELKSQLTAVTTKCHQFENELSDVASDVADATMPLSLEIEKLQQEIKNHSLISLKRENALQSKITDLEQRLKQGQDRESSFTDMQQSYQLNVSALESQVDTLESDYKRLQAVLEAEKSTSKMKLEESCKTMEDMANEIEGLKRVIESVENELRFEQTERKKYQSLLEHGTASNRNSNINLVPTTQSSSTMISSTTSQKLNNSGQSGNNSPSNQSVLSEVCFLDEVFEPNVRSDLTPKSSFFESFSSVNVIENLHSQLRLREGELAQYQDEVAKNEKIRKTLNEEIAQLTIQNQEFLMQMDKMTELQNRIENVEQNYNAVLQMYGEKVEEAEELRLDLHDVKEMYKAQIEQLLKR